MKTTHTVMSWAVAGTLALSGASVWAGAKKTNRDANKPLEATAALTAVQTIATAHSLVRYGDANKDALALITAARMLKQTGSQPSDAKREGAVTAERKGGEPKFEADAVLTRAKTYANGRADLVALIEDVSKGGARGAVGGPRQWRSMVSGGVTDVYRVTFRGGEPAGVAVSGDGDSDLDLYVHDENGNLICKDDDRTDDMICRWRPAWTGVFTIRIKNRGIANEYVAIHN